MAKKSAANPTERTTAPRRRHGGALEKLEGMVDEALDRARAAEPRPRNEMAPETESLGREQGLAPEAQPEPVPVSEANKESGGITGLIAVREHPKPLWEEGLICYNHVANRIELVEDGGVACAVTKVALIHALTEMAGVEWHSWDDPRILELMRTGQGLEEFSALFAGVPSPWFFIWLSLRLYPDTEFYRSSIENYPLPSPKIASEAVRAAIQRVISVKKGLCEFFGEPGVFELIACLSNSSDRATIIPVMDRERTRISRPQGDVIPLLSDAELPPPPSDGRASKVERRIRASALAGAFEHIEADLVKLHDPVVARFQKVLDALYQDGKACATFEGNQELTRRLVELADRFGIKLFFATPDRLRHEVRVHCVNTPRSAAGVFRVQAANKKNTQFSSSPAFPHLIAGRAATDPGADAG